MFKESFFTLTGAFIMLIVIILAVAGFYNFSDFFNHIATAINDFLEPYVQKYG